MWILRRLEKLSCEKELSKIIDAYCKFCQGNLKRKSQIHVCLFYLFDFLNTSFGYLFSRKRKSNPITNIFFRHFNQISVNFLTLLKVSTVSRTNCQSEAAGSSRVWRFRLLTICRSASTNLKIEDNM